MNLKIFYLIIFFFLINFPVKSEDKFKLIYECEDESFNFEITQGDLTKVKLSNGKQLIAHAGSHSTGQKTFEWGRVIISESIQVRFHQIYGTNRLVINKVELDKEELEAILKKAKEDKIGVELEKLKAEIFYKKWKNNKSRKLGEIKCKLKKKIKY